MKTYIEKKLSSLHVKTLEEEILLIKNGEINYNNNGGKDVKQAYVDGLKYFDNIKIKNVL